MWYNWWRHTPLSLTLRQSKHCLCDMTIVVSGKCCFHVGETTQEASKEVRHQTDQKFCKFHDQVLFQTALFWLKSQLSWFTSYSNWPVESGGATLAVSANMNVTSLPGATVVLALLRQIHLENMVVGIPIHGSKVTDCKSYPSTQKWHWLSE